MNKRQHVWTSQSKTPMADVAFEFLILKGTTGKEDVKRIKSC